MGKSSRVKSITVISSDRDRHASTMFAPNAQLGRLEFVRFMIQLRRLRDAMGRPKREANSWSKSTNLLLASGSPNSRSLLWSLSRRAKEGGKFMVEVDQFVIGLREPQFEKCTVVPFQAGPRLGISVVHTGIYTIFENVPKSSHASVLRSLIQRSYTFGAYSMFEEKTSNIFSWCVPLGDYAY